MTEEASRSPLDHLLDLLVFGPAGLALTAAEEFPKLAHKGRHHIEGQVHTARVVGQFAVQFSRRELEGRLHGLLGAAPARPASRAEPAPPPPAPASGDTMALAEGVGANGAGPTPVSVEPDPSLAIPGYDSLSASQVVQRLAGLTLEELVAIGRHERTHRGRRTILNRVDQLLDAAGPESVAANGEAPQP